MAGMQTQKYTTEDEDDNCDEKEEGSGSDDTSTSPPANTASKCTTTTSNESSTTTPISSTTATDTAMSETADMVKRRNYTTPNSSGSLITAEKPARNSAFTNPPVPNTAKPSSMVTTQSSKAALVMTVTLPLVAVIFLFVCFILLWKKTSNNTKSKGDSLKSQNNEIKQELGEVKGKFKDPYPVEHSVNSMNHYTDPNSDEKRNEGALANKNKAVGEAQYAKVDKKAQRKSKDTRQNGKVPPSVHYTVDAQGSHGYEEAIIRGTQSNDGYEEAKVEGTQNKGYEEAKDRGTLGDQGYETAKVTGPFYHTLDPDAPSDSSYMTVSRSNQDGGYDALDRQQDSNQAKSKTDSGYDVTGRIGKGDIKVESSNQTDNDYSAISRGSANTSGYDKLDQTRRSYEVDSISPNDYNVLQPQEA